MNEHVKKELIKLFFDLIFIAIIVVVFTSLHKNAGTAMAESYWEAEEEANKKRLFGDAWKDV
jgi:hypothetical protein